MAFEYEEWTCPLRNVVWELTGEDGEGGLEPVETIDCGATLHVSSSFSWPVPTDDDGHAYTTFEIATNAYTDGWEVTCENGHTLARSRSAEDTAEPFDMERVMAAVGATKERNHV